MNIKEKMLTLGIVVLSIVLLISLPSKLNSHTNILNTSQKPFRMLGIPRLVYNHGRSVSYT